MKKAKIHIKEPFFIQILRVFVHPFVRLFLGYKNKDKYYAKKGEKVFVLSNHQTDYDPILVRLAFNRYLYTVATDNIFANKKTAKWLTRLGGIPKRKGLADINAVRKMIDISRHGGSILLFPEGNRSYAEFQYYITENIVNMLKKMQATIVLFNIHGGFGSFPRFGSKRRIGPFYGQIKKVLKYEEYIKMSDQELYDLILDNLKVYDSESNAEYNSNSRAEYLERMFFVCPKCGKAHHLRSEGNFIRCDNCGLTVEYRKDLHLISDDSSFSFSRLVEWYDYQKQWVKEYKIKNNEEIIFSDENVEVYLANPFENRELLTKGKLVLTGQSICVNNVKFSLNDLEIASPVSQRKLCITVNDKNYEFKGEERFNALKYVLMFNHLDTKMKKNKIDHYFNL